MCISPQNSTHMTAPAVSRRSNTHVFNNPTSAIETALPVCYIYVCVCVVCSCVYGGGCVCACVCDGCWLSLCVIGLKTIHSRRVLQYLCEERTMCDVMACAICCDVCGVCGVCGVISFLMCVM